MAIRIALNHVTSYRYDRPVKFSPHVVRLRPAPHCRTPIVAYSLRVSPAEHFLNWQQDPFGNHQARLVFPSPAPELRVEVDLVADLTTINPFDFFLDEQAEKLPLRYDARLPDRAAALPGAGRRAAGSSRSFCERAREGIALAGRRTVDVLVDINRLVQRALRYDVRMEPGVFSARGDLDPRPRLLPRLRLVAGAAAAPPGVRRPLRLGLLDPAHAPIAKAGERTAGRRRGRHRSARLGGGLPAGRGLGGARRHQRPDVRRRAHPPGLHRRAEPAPPPSRGSFSWDKRNEDEKLGEAFSFAMEVRAPRRPAPPDQAVRREDLAGHPAAAAIRWSETLAAAGRPPHDGRRADLRVDRRPRGRGVEHRRRWARASCSRRQHLAAQAAAALRARRASAPRPGQVVPGRAPAPLGVSRCYFRKDGEPIWRDPSLYRRRGSRSSGRPARDAGLRRCPLRAPGRRPIAPAARLRRRLLLPVARAAAAGQRRSVRRPPR